LGRDEGPVHYGDRDQQNPDLCGVVGFWDVMDLGAAAAIKESGKPIVLVTSGGGEQMACDNVEKGVFQEEIAYHVLNQGQDLTDVVATVLESGQPAGKEKIVIYTPATKITKDTLHPGMCWSAKNLKN
jgi:ribose transport system substrate-binding protein